MVDNEKPQVDIEAEEINKKIGYLAGVRKYVEEVMGRKKSYTLEEAAAALTKDRAEKFKKGERPSEVPIERYRQALNDLAQTTTAVAGRLWTTLENNSVFDEPSNARYMQMADPWMKCQTWKPHVSGRDEFGIIIGAATVLLPEATAIAGDNNKMIMGIPKERINDGLIEKLGKEIDKRQGNWESPFHADVS